MATSRTSLDNAIREKYIKIVTDHLTGAGEEVLVTGSNEISLPCVDSEGNEKFIVLTFKVPTGSRDGEPYNGYNEASDYAAHLVAKKEKAAIAAEKKARKIEADKKLREERARLKAEEKGEQSPFFLRFFVRHTFEISVDFKFVFWYN